MIDKHNKLIARGVDDFSQEGIAVNVFHKVIGVDYENRKVEVLDIKRGKRFFKSYDQLVITTGAEPFIPEFISDGMKNVFTLRDIQDGIKLNTLATYRSGRFLIHSLVPPKVARSYL